LRIYYRIDDSLPLLTGDSGYAVYKADDKDGFEVYTDDGKGNGDYVCHVIDQFYLDKVIAGLLLEE